MKTFHIGDKVRYSGEFLRSTGMYTGPAGFARGVVTGVQQFRDGAGNGGMQLVTIDWGKDEMPPRVAAPNLERAR